MSRWFRVYDDLVDDPKVQRLNPDQFRALINLWCLASKGGGILPTLDEIAFKLRMSEQKARAVVAGLCNAGLLDENETGLTPHNWSGRQHKHDSSNERVKRHRERKRNAAVTVTATRPETETERTEAEASGGGAPPSDPAIEKRELYRRAKEVLGDGYGGLMTRLLAAKHGNLALSRAAIESASQAGDPHDYIGRIISKKGRGHASDRSVQSAAAEIDDWFSSSGSPH